MRAIRELPLAAPLVLAFYALFFGGGPGNASIPWLGAGALASVLVLGGQAGVPAGLPRVLPLAALATWCAVSIWWSWLPDRSWDYANRTLVYALCAAVGMWAAARTRDLATGLAAVLGAVVCWSLLGKVLPGVYDYGFPSVSRLQGPIGLWNQLALAADFALVLALARRGRSGTLLAYVALVALFLTYSRGGIVTAVMVVAVWLAFGEGLADSVATLLAGLVPAALVTAVAFALPGVTKDFQARTVRAHDGWIFGAMLVAGALASLALERVPRVRDERLLRRTLAGVGALVVVAAVAVVAVHGIGGGTVTNSSGRITNTSSNFRFTWWREAWRGFTHHPLAGTGAGSFHLVNLRYRATYLDETTEPHDLPLQFLSEAGVVGLALLGAALAVLLWPAARRRGPELALALLLPAYLVHSLVDVDWDFAAVSVPAFLAAGAVAGGALRPRLSPFALLPALGAALLVFGVLLLPWLGTRWSTDALGAPAKQAVSLAKRAHSVDPLLVEPYWAQAQAADDRNNEPLAFAWYRAAVRRQPQNPQTWLAAGEYALNVANCPFQGYVYLEKYTELDQKARPDEGGNDYNRARTLVNERRYTC